MAVTTTNLGVITAYGDAVAAGYTGTKAEWQTLMASYATVGQQAVNAKNDAVGAKTAAETAASNSEAYAIGKRNGTDVTSGDAAYHNNAKYYAEQAATSVASLTVDSAMSSSSTNPVQNKVINAEITELKEDLTNIASGIDDGETSAVYPTMTTGQYINTSGTLVVNNNSALVTSDYIAIPDGAYTIVLAGLCGLSVMNTYSFYDADYTYLSGSGGSWDALTDTEVTVPSGAVYIRLSHYISSGYLASGVNYRFYLFERLATIEANATTGANVASIVNEELNESVVEGTVLDVFTDKTKLEGIYITPQSSQTVDVENANFNSSKYFAVNAQTYYTFVNTASYGGTAVGISQVYFYDSNKACLGYAYGGYVTYQTPVNCAYMRFSTASLNLNFDSLVVEVGNNEVSLPVSNPTIVGINPYSSLYGKQWLAIGDSITEKNFRAAARYHDFIRAETGCTVYNAGDSGTGYLATQSSSTAFYQRVEAGTYDDADPDFITILGGINDALSSETLGDYTDTGTDTVMGCVYTLVTDVRTKWPDAPLGIITPFPASQSGFEQNPNDDTCYVALLVAELKKFCNYYNIPLLDMFHNSGFRPSDATFKATYTSCASATSGDGLHPNYYGHKWVYPKIREFVKTLI